MFAIEVPGKSDRFGCLTVGNSDHKRLAPQIKINTLSVECGGQHHLCVCEYTVN